MRHCFPVKSPFLTCQEFALLFFTNVDDLVIFVVDLSTIETKSPSLRITAHEPCRTERPLERRVEGDAGRLEVAEGDGAGDLHHRRRKARLDAGHGQDAFAAARR